MKSPLVARINSLLAEQGKTKTEFFEACHITSSTFSQWNTGKTSPRMGNLNTIADYLGVNLDYLMTGLGEKEKKEKPTFSGELSEEEEVLIQKFRSAGSTLQAAALSVLDSASSEE